MSGERETRHHFHTLTTLLRSHQELLFVVMVALLVRLAAVLPVHAGGYTSDEKEYISMARHLADGGEFIDSNGERSTRAPLFPYAMALITRIVGGSLVVAHMIGVLFGTAIVVLGYMLSMRVWGDHAAALVASGAIAVYPGFIVYAGILQTETLYTVLLLLAFLVVYRIIGGGTLNDGVALGLVSGLASLTRVVFVGFFPVLLSIIWWKKRKEGRAVVPLLLVALVAWSITLAPWTIRNYRVHHAFIPVSSGGGSTLLTGNNPFATGTWRSEDGFESWYKQNALDHGIENVDGLGEVQRSEVNREIAIEYVKSHPANVAQLAVKKAHIFWVYPITHTDSNVPLQAAASFLDAVLLLGAVLGCAAMWDTRARLVPLYGAMMFFFITQVVLHAEARFRLPLVPLLCLFFGQGCAVILDRARRSDFLGARPKIIASVVLAGCVVSVYTYTAWLFLQGTV